MDLLLRSINKPPLLSTICASCRRKLQLSQPSRRPYQLSHRHNQNTSSTSSSNPTQVHPLGDFYADLLSKPIPQESTATTRLSYPPTPTPSSSSPSDPSSPLPTFVDTGGDLTKEERAARLFGSIRGSGYERHTTPTSTWQTINGVPVPPRPSEPDNCCMSGCVHCVWDDYRDDIEDWARRLKEAQAKATGAGSTRESKIDMPRPEVATASTSMDDDGGGSEALWTGGEGQGEELFKGIPVGIREFMNVEKRIRERKERRLAGQSGDG